MFLQRTISPATAFTRVVQLNGRVADDAPQIHPGLIGRVELPIAYKHLERCLLQDVLGIGSVLHHSLDKPQPLFPMQDHQALNNSGQVQVVTIAGMHDFLAQKLDSPLDCVGPSSRPYCFG
jgi:hypothetical protein